MLMVLLFIDPYSSRNEMHGDTPSIKKEPEKNWTQIFWRPNFRTKFWIANVKTQINFGYFQVTTPVSELHKLPEQLKPKNSAHKALFLFLTQPTTQPNKTPRLCHLLYNSTPLAIHVTWLTNPSLLAATCHTAPLAIAICQAGRRPLPKPLPPSCAWTLSVPDAWPRPLPDAWPIGVSEAVSGTHLLWCSRCVPLPGAWPGPILKTSPTPRPLLKSSW